MENRHSRSEILLGQNALVKLRAAKVGILGLGGVGSYACEALARAGIGHLVLIDPDKVTESNLNRQLVALETNLGQPKILAMAERLQQIDSSLKLTLCPVAYQPGSGSMLDGLDFVVDAIDDLPAKIDLLIYCHQQQIPLISCMGAGNKLDPTAFKIADLFATSVCPLAKVLRQKLRAKGITSGIPVVFSTESPRTTGSSTIGSVSFVPAAAGLILASHVIKKISGYNSPNVNYSDL